MELIKSGKGIINNGFLEYENKEGKVEKYLIVNSKNFRQKVKFKKILDASNCLIRDTIPFVDAFFRAEYNFQKNKSHQVFSGLDDATCDEMVKKERLYFFIYEDFKSAINNNKLRVVDSTRQNFKLLKKNKVLTNFISFSEEESNFLKIYFEHI